MLNFQRSLPREVQRAAAFGVVKEENFTYFQSVGELLSEVMTPM
jgi:hypothetical protein